MMTFVLVIHIIVCAVLIILVLIQRGRGGGLVDSFQGVESMFGTKTNAFLTRVTTIFSIIFFCTCLGLAVLSVRQSRSLLRNVRNVMPVKQEAAKEAPKPQEQAPAAPVQSPPSADQPQAQAPAEPKKP